MIAQISAECNASPHCGQYSFCVPLWVAGWDGLGGWLHNETIFPPKDGHLYQY